MAATGDLPRDFDGLRRLIVERRDTLPKRLGQVATHALSSPDDIAFGTVASIAAAADVQPSTLVRFAQSLGYSGFSELQDIFRDRLRERTSSYEERLTALEEMRADRPDDAAILSGFLAAARRSVEEFGARVDTDAFRRSVDRLAAAETLYLVAKRRSFPLASHMAYAFAKLGVRFQLVASENGIDAEIAAMATAKDAAIAISFAPYAADSLASATRMAAAGVPVVAVTDSHLSPLAGLAGETILVAEADFAGFRSLSATMALVMALPVAIAERRRSAGGRKPKAKQ